jgi:hypothetical protein
MTTPDQNVAEKIGREIDIQIRRLNEERGVLLSANTRLLAIDAELQALAVEKARIDGRRPPAPVITSDRGQPIAVPEIAQ